MTKRGASTRAITRNSRRAAANAQAVTTGPDPVRNEALDRSVAALRKTIGPNALLARDIELRSRISARKAAATRERRRADELSVAAKDPEPDENVRFWLASAETQRTLATNLDRLCKTPANPTKAQSGEAASNRAKRSAYRTEAKLCDRRAADARSRQLESHRQGLEQAEIEATAEARSDPVIRVPTAVSSWARDEHGAMVREKGEPVLVTERATPMRRASAGLATRLARFKLFSGRQIGAALQLERDAELANLEPSMIANLQGTGGGGGQADISTAAAGARNRLQAARRALRRGGDDVVRAVEEIVIAGARMGESELRRFTDEPRHNAYMTTLLAVGTNLLAEHYADPQTRRDMAGAKISVDAV